MSGQLLRRDAVKISQRVIHSHVTTVVIEYPDSVRRIAVKRIELC